MSRQQLWTPCHHRESPDQILPAASSWVPGWMKCSPCFSYDFLSERRTAPQSLGVRVFFASTDTDPISVRKGRLHSFFSRALRSKLSRSLATHQATLQMLATERRSDHVLLQQIERYSEQDEILH